MVKLKAKITNSTKNLRSLLSKRESCIVLFFLSLFLFNWPFLSTPDQAPEKMFIYLFLVWGLIIFVLFLISKMCALKDSCQDQTDKKKEK